MGNGEGERDTEEREGIYEKEMEKNSQSNSIPYMSILLQKNQTTNK